MKPSKALRRLSGIYRYIATFLLTSLLLLFLGHLLLGLARSAKNMDVNQIFDTEGRVDRRAYLPVYDDFPEREQLWLDHSWKTHFEPYIHWRRGEWTSRFVNIDERGVRRTVKDPLPGAKKVFVFGGSTTWGTGSPDDMTIPSRLQALLGRTYDVYNFGETGYVSTQELNLLLKLLADGDIPDVVIFYDGNNDSYAGAYSPAIPRDPQNLRARHYLDERGAVVRFIYDLYRGSNYRRLVGWLRDGKTWASAAWDERVKGREEELAKGVVDYYLAHVRQVRALGREYGFQSFFFWQPNVMSGRRLYPYERDFLEKDSPVFVATQRKVYEEARRRLAGREAEGIFFIANVLDEADVPAYLDWSHTSPQANAIIAREMYLRLKGRI